MALPPAKKFAWQIILAGVAWVLLRYQPSLTEGLVRTGWPGVAGVVAGAVEILAWLAGGWLGISLVGMLLWAVVERPRGRPLPKLLNDIINSVIIFSILLSILGSVFNAPISGLVAGSSVVAAVIGLAITRMIADVFSGLALNLEKSYHLGDWLEIEMRHRPGGAVTARVMEINWRATRLLTLANEVLVIPNSEMARSKFINYSLPEERYRAEVQVPLSHAIPTERVRRILLAAVHSAVGVLAEPAPFVSLVRFDQRGVIYAVRFWVGDFSQNRPVLDAVNENILRHLQVAGVNISYNRVEQRFIKSDASELNKKPVKEALLARLDLFEFLNEEQINRLAEQMQEHLYQAGASIVGQGQEGASLFIVAEGLVDILVRDNGGEEAWVAHIEPGRYLGEMSLLTGQPRAASARAATEVVAYEIDKKSLEPVFQAQPELLERISMIMAERQAQLCRIQEGADAGICEFTAAGSGHWLLAQMQRFFGIKRG